MERHLILKLIGNLRQDGFHLNLVIPSEVDGAVREDLGIRERHGTIPADPVLADYVAQHWEVNYRQLGESYRQVPNDQSLGDPNPSNLDLNYRIVPKKTSQLSSLQQRLELAHTSAQDLINQFHRWLNCDIFRAIEREILSCLDAEDSVHLSIRCDDLVLPKLPWHSWAIADHVQQFSWYLSPLNSNPQLVQTTPRTNPNIRILSILGDSRGIDVVGDRQEIDRLIPVATTFLVEPCRADVGDSLWENPWEILFFAGHSGSEGDRGQLWINREDRLSVGQLRHAIATAVKKGLQVVILNSCDGLAIAQDLSDLQVPAIIVMREAVPNEVAQTFLRYFLPAFAQGATLQTAFNTARQRLESIEDRFPFASWLPVLYCQPHLVNLTWHHLFAPPPPQLDPTPPAPQPTFPTESPPTPQPHHWPQRRTIARWGWGIAAVILAWFIVRPHAAFLLNAQGLSYGKMFKRDLEITYYTLATRVNPQWAGGFYNLGDLCLEKGDLQCAILNLQKAADRGLPEAYAQLANAQIKNHNFAVAIQSAEICLLSATYESTKAACYKNRAWALIKLDRWQEAEAALIEALRLREDSPHAQCLMAQVREHQKQWQDAEIAWQKVSALAKYRNFEEQDCLAKASEFLENNSDSD
jgi:tetratricopeptide (TPR) repeat protein